MRRPTEPVPGLERPESDVRTRRRLLARARAAELRAGGGCSTLCREERTCRVCAGVFSAMAVGALLFAGVVLQSGASLAASLLLVTTAWVLGFVARENWRKASVMSLDVSTIRAGADEARRELDAFDTARQAERTRRRGRLRELGAHSDET